jgi:hypothetical protein
MTVSITWNGTYNSGLTNFLTAKVKNELDALP